MNTPGIPLRIATFGVGLTLVFGAAVGIGALIGPVGTTAAASHEETHTAQRSADSPLEASDQPPGGLMVSQSGYTLQLERSRLRPGRQQVEFSISGPEGEVLRDYAVEHEKELHLIAVRRDFAGFQHVHPIRDESGTWSVELDLTPGSWRLFADFRASGAESLTLGTDLIVTGDAAGPAPEPAGEIRVAGVEGYQVTLEGDLRPGSHSQLRLNVRRGQQPVTDLQPYLGAYGHLVALREGDMAYLHVHPEGGPEDGRTQPGPDISFVAEVPSQGRYYLYLDFRHRGKVRTAPFVLDAGGVTSADVTDVETDDEDGHDH